MGGSSTAAWLDAKCIGVDEFRRVASFSEEVVEVSESGLRLRPLDVSVLSLLDPTEAAAATAFDLDCTLPPFPVSALDIIDFKRGANGDLIDVDLEELRSVLLDAVDDGAIASPAPTMRDLRDAAPGVDFFPASGLSGHQVAAATARHAKEQAEKERAIAIYAEQGHLYKNKDDAAEQISKVVELQPRTIRDLLKGMPKPPHR